MRHFARTAPLAALAVLCWLAVPAAAQTPPAGADPVVARVDGAEIHASDVQDAMQGLPGDYRNMPPQALYPALLEQLIDRKAVGVLARKQGLERDPEVQHDMARAQEEALQSALFHREIGPLVSDAAVRAEIKKGGDFAAIAKARSSDPGGAQGGDLGWFKKGDMLPEFSEVAFALKPGEIAPKPVQTRYGWHVIKVEERRIAPPPSFEQAREELRNQMIQESVQKLVATARAGVKVEKFNPDGSPVRATDAAEPPAVTKK